MFNNISNKKVYEQVIEQIQNNIMEGLFKKGDKLPSERELSEKMGVSRTSIREALRVLETMGVIESRQGEGNFICSNIEKSLLQPLSMMFKLNNGSFSDIYELRSILEIECARLSAIRATDMDCRELLSVVEEMEQETFGENRYEILVELDKKFHNTLSDMTKNYLIESLFSTISNLFEKFIEDARYKIILFDSEQANKSLLIQHKKICESIIKKNQDMAVEAMREHMEYVMENAVK
ncbi:FadR/GntR family transcriptional regulator [Intestinibacter sp.]|uniref:FadR/GntR family transcriptional regulator n=1 Tax=Intestinibacter sp. TaxID=1965304 RepID=UPI002A752ED4|nr:FadR/GntR family transcriptional regulator [Intestinibacter sp.]MDY2736396.1 FadR/GntR family transcriptional regulator [Intestinibacter sp.]MDY4574294.1 FadR/GntR family transcriptional regulator [Intestinibacter sp.]